MHLRDPRLFLPILLLLSACRPDPPVPPSPPVDPPIDTTGTDTTGTLRITLVPTWEGEPFERFTEYSNFMDYRVTVELLKMYFGDVRLIQGEDTLVVKDVDLFDLGDGNVSADWPVQTGSWTKLRAALGVPDTLNYADPANYGPGHPLNVSNATYWHWAIGYRYVMFEGRYDTDPESTEPLITAYAIHPGMGPSYVEFELLPTGGISIAEDEVTELVVQVAVDRFFHSDAYTIDLATENTAHGDNLPLQLKLVNNVIASFSVE